MDRNKIFDNFKFGELFANVMANGAVNMQLIEHLPEKWKLWGMLAYNAAHFFYAFALNPKRLNWDYAAAALDNGARLAEYQAKKHQEVADSLEAKGRDSGESVI